MKLHFTYDWLRSQIERDDDIECDAGTPVLDAAPLEQFVRDERPQESIAMKPAPERKAAVLHVLVHQVRRRDDLSIAQFADLIRVDAYELEMIEKDPNYTPKPRTLHQLASYLKVSAQAVQNLTAEAIARNDNIEKAALKFAASSKDLSSLSPLERRGLNDFVKFLSTYGKGK